MSLARKITTWSTPRVAMGASLLVSLLMLLGKGAAFLMTGSAAILSDAAESVIHLFATSFAGFSLWYAAEPADPNHPYGHGKIAYFAAGVEGSLILMAALSIFYAAGRALVVGPELQALGSGLAVVGGLALVNLCLGLFLVHTGRRHGSLVLVSNGQHVLTDMWTSLGVIAGVALVWWTGLAWLDPVVAILVALNILWTAAQLLSRSVAGLMEKVNPEDTKALLGALEEAKRQGLIKDFHQVRHRRVNDQMWVEYHLLFPGRLSITEAHERSHAVEEQIGGLFPERRVYVTAHLEPAAHGAAHPEGHAEPVDPLRAAALVRARHEVKREQSR